MSNPYYPAHELDSMGAALLNPQVLSARGSAPRTPADAVARLACTGRLYRRLYRRPPAPIWPLRAIPRWLRTATRIS